MDDNTSKASTSSPALRPEVGAAGEGAAVAESARVLVVDDEPAMRRSLERLLASKGFQMATAEDGEKALERLAHAPADVVLVDLIMPRLGGMELLARLKERHPEVEVIIMTAHGSYDAAVSAVRAGAYHFLTKPFQPPDVVPLTVAMAAERKRLLSRARELERRLEQAEQARGLGGLVGESAAMREIYQEASRVAATDVTVLILGESGTGKELVARAIHERSGRRDKPFVPVNCGAIPPDLVESELFGHVKGAFTGANAAREGIFGEAHRGTVFLDELGELPLAAQAKLLRTLQEGEVRRVGSNEARRVDVRVIAATNNDLERQIAEGKFRGDLYYRLNVVPITLPPLRERREDIPLLARHFLRKHAGRVGREVRSISAEAMRLLSAHDWPGNVRQLENFVQRAMVRARGASIVPADLPFSGGQPAEEPPTLELAGLALPEGWAGQTYAEAKSQVLGAFHDTYLKDLMRRAEGNVSEAARLAGLDRSNFRRLLKRPPGGQDA
jgi:DNA-binding NtrC family response regulator